MPSQQNQPNKLYNQRSFDIPPGDNLTEPLSFYPLSVIVDNYSGYWIHLQDAGRYVPPYTVGAILPLIHAIQAYADWNFGPYGPQVITTTVGQIAHLTYTDDPNLTYSGGTSIGSQPQAVNQAIWEYVNASIVTTISDTIHTWLASDVKPSFTRVSTSITVRGSSPGAAECRFGLYVSDGTNTWYLSQLVVDETVPARETVIFKGPTVGLNLDATKAWTLNTVGFKYVGTPAIDAFVIAEWI